MSPPQRSARKRPQQILEAAVEVIVDRGLCETRIADVAKRARTSSGLIVYYFSSKDRLLTEALTFAEDRFYLQTFHELTGLESARDQLLHLMELALPGGEAEDDVTRDWTLWLELWLRALHDPEAAKKREALDRRWRSTIQDIVRAGQRSGEFRRIDAERFAQRLAALIDGLAVQGVLRDSEITPKRMRVLCLEMAEGELGFDVSTAGARVEANP